MLKFVLKAADYALGIIWAMFVFMAFVFAAWIGVQLLVDPFDIWFLVRLLAAQLGCVVLGAITLVLWWAANKMDLWP